MVNWKFWDKSGADKKVDEKTNDVSKNKKLSGDVVRVKVHRLLNGTPIEIAIFDGVLTRDKNNNTIIFDEENDFKEELPGIQDTLISDILYKLKSRSNSKAEQLKQIDKAIKNQQDVINAEVNGFISKKGKKNKDKDDSKEDSGKIKVNRQTELSKLRILKCSKYALMNKDGDGFFESIDIHGNRILSYVIIDGELIPYWFKTPSIEGEPVVLIPDVTGRKKFFKEAETEAIQDFNESVDWFWKGWLGVAMKGLTVLFLAVLVVWTVYLIRWNGDLYDGDLEPKIQALQLENQRTQQRCNEQIAQQMENNGVIFDYARLKMSEDLSSPISKGGGSVDNSNIKI